MEDIALSRRKRNHDSTKASFHPTETIFTLNDSIPYITLSKVAVVAYSMYQEY